VAVWTCPECDRTFGRARQGHLCVPATTVNEWFADEPSEQRQIRDRIVEHLDMLGDVRVEAVAVGIFYKRGRNLAELRPRADHLGVALVLPEGSDHPRFSRRTPMSGERMMYSVPLRTSDDVDDQVRDWLTVAWDLCG